MRDSVTFTLIGLCLVIASGFFLWHNLGPDLVAAGALKAFAPTQWLAPAYVLASIFLMAIGLGILGHEFHAVRLMSTIGVAATSLIALSAGADVMGAYTANPSLAALEASGRWLSVGIGTEALAFAIFFMVLVIQPRSTKSDWVLDWITILSMLGGVALALHTFTGAHWGWAVIGGFTALVSGGFLTWRWFSNIPQIWKNLAFVSGLIVGGGAVFIMVTGLQAPTADMLRVGGGFLALIPSVLLFRWSITHD